MLSHGLPLHAPQKAVDYAAPGDIRGMKWGKGLWRWGITEFRAQPPISYFRHFWLITYMQKSNDATVPPPTLTNVESSNILFVIVKSTLLKYDFTTHCFPSSTGFVHKAVYAPVYYVCISYCRCGLCYSLKQEQKKTNVCKDTAADILLCSCFHFSSTVYNVSVKTFFLNLFFL